MNRVIEAMVPPPPGLMAVTMTLPGTGWMSTTSLRVCESAGVMITSSSRPKFGPVAVSPSGVVMIWSKVITVGCTT
ncbi:hypothetical protein D3C77_767880 [compost metagenome]